MKVILITLSGQGDTERFLVPVEVYEWMLGIPPGNFAFPTEVLTALAPFKTTYADDWEEFTKDIHNASTGSATNDVALHLSCITHHYDSLRQVIKACTDNGWDLVDEWEGDIY